MFEAIQRAYYQESRNPSDTSTLTELAEETGLDTNRFSEDISSPTVEQALQDGFRLRRSLNANQFPSLILQAEADPEPRFHWLTKGYADAPSILAKLRDARAAVH